MKFVDAINKVKFEIEYFIFDYFPSLYFIYLENGIEKMEIKNLVDKYRYDIWYNPEIDDLDEVHDSNFKKIVKAIGVLNFDFHEFCHGFSRQSEEEK